MLVLNTINIATAKDPNPFQQEESKSKPFKVVVNLEYTEKQYKEGVGYLICVTTLKDGHDNCINDSRSPGVDKERVHLKIP